MAASATLEKNGERKQIPLGFSWTGLIFQWIVPIFRKDPNWLKYNQMYAKTLLDNGWKPATESDKQALIGNGVNL